MISLLLNIVIKCIVTCLNISYHGQASIEIKLHLMNGRFVIAGFHVQLSLKDF